MNSRQHGETLPQISRKADEYKNKQTILTFNTLVPNHYVSLMSNKCLFQSQLQNSNYLTMGDSVEHNLWQN